MSALEPPGGGVQGPAEERAHGAAARPEVWGPWSTAGFGLAVAVTFMAAQVAVAVAAAVLAASLDPTLELGNAASRVAGDGLVLASATWASAAAAGGLLLIVVLLRKGSDPRLYLGLVPVRWRDLLTALVATAVLAAAYDAVAVLLERPVVPPFMLDAYRSCRFTPLLWGAVVVAAPAFEEAFFRGFLLEGWRRSRLGGAGAAVLTALLWAVIHLQYGLFEIVAIFILGLVLAAVRLATGSLLPCLAAHALVNLVATVQTALRA